MDFLDKVANAAKNVGQTVAKTTGELYDRGKIKLGIVQAQNDLKDLYREYGEYMYKAEKKGGVDAGAKEDFVGKADALNARIRELQEKEQQLREQEEKEAAERAAEKDAPKCPACGAPRMDGSEFCGNCGVKF